MTSRLQEIEGRFVGERYRSGDFFIGSIVVASGSRSLAEQAGFDGDRLTIKGEAEPDEIQPRQTYRFYGQWTDYQSERQFTFRTFVAAVAHDRDGVVAYLESVGKGLGLGAKTASMAFDRWGGDAVRVIRENPRELLNLSRRFSDDDLDQIRQRLEALAKTEGAQIEVTNLLSGRGFPKSVFRKVIKSWGNQAAEIIRTDPYRLMSFRGCGFKRCDALYIELGLDPTSMLRQALSAWYAIASNTDGHVWFPIEFAKQAVRAAIGRAARPDEAIEFACELAKTAPNRNGALAILRTNAAGQITENGTTLWVAEGRKAATEERLAVMVADALAEIEPREITLYEEAEFTETELLQHVRCCRCSRELTAPTVHVWNGKPFGPTCIQSISDGSDVEVVSLADWMARNPRVVQYRQEVAVGTKTLPQLSLWPEVDTIRNVSDHQRAELSRSLVGRIGILGGSPGTGKTRTTAMLLDAVLASGLVSPEDIIIGAPTGKATVRLNEAFQINGVHNVRARTWHSWLGVGEPDEESGSWTFHHNAQNPWSCKIIIGDEESMKDLSLMCAVMAARPRGAHVLLVGDINQLPPVGCGAPLRDLILAGLPYGHLTQIMRNSGGIVEACRDIRDGRKWEPGDNLRMIEVSQPDQQLDAVVETLHGFGDDFDPIWDSQVIVAVNKRSELCRKVVNERLQRELNPNRPVKESPFRVDDKIVCTANGWYPLVPGFGVNNLDPSMVREKDEYGRYDVYVANGELGRVLAIEEKKLTVGLFNPSREISVHRGKFSSSDDEGTSTAGVDDDSEDSATGCKFELAYGISCHRMQGSEVPNCIVLIDDYPGAKNICSREWLMTAISRARSSCVLIGQRSTANGFCRRVALPKRKTFLCERIRLLQAEKILEELLR